MNIEDKVRRLELELTLLRDRLDEAEDTEGDIPFGADDALIGEHLTSAAPAPSNEVPPAVGVGAIGTQRGVFALSDHTHGGIAEHPEVTQVDVVTSVVEESGELEFVRRTVGVHGDEPGPELPPIPLAAAIDAETIEVGFIDEDADPDPERVRREFYVVPEES